MSEHLHWRYATKKFDPAKKIPPREFAVLLDALRLAPSSFGLQPWKFIVVEDPDVRRQLKTHAWDQAQLVDASHLIVLCVLKSMDENYVKQFTARVAGTRNVPTESLSGYEQMMLGFLKATTPEARTQWMKHQVYIALGMLLSECAHMNIDACPMEGFDAKKFDDILGLEQQGLSSVVLCAMGYRAKDDHYAGLKKVRFEQHEVFLKK